MDAGYKTILDNYIMKYIGLYDAYIGIMFEA